VQPPPPGPAPAGCWAGLDGCRSGWVLVVLDGDGVAPAGGSAPGAVVAGPLTISAHRGFTEAVHEAQHRAAAAIGVDMPIGLSLDGRRAADDAARRLLGSRRSTVFPTPARAVLDAVDYRDALARHRAACGKGLSIQAWNLVAKIAEVDRWVTPAHDGLVFEVHPELAFSRLAGAVLAEPKKTPEGRARRLALIGDALGLDAGDRAALVGARPARGVAADDVLDAAAVALSARALAGGTGTVLGDGGRDPFGRPMRICF